MLLSTVPPKMYMASEITAAAWKSLPLGSWAEGGDAHSSEPQPPLCERGRPQGPAAGVMQSGPGAPLTSEAGGPGCLAVLVPKSSPNTSRDFLKPPRSSEGSAGASSDADARSGTSAPPTWRGEAGGWDSQRGRRRAPADPDPGLRMVWAGPGRSRGAWPGRAPPAPCRRAAPCERKC